MKIDWLHHIVQNIFHFKLLSVISCLTQEPNMQDCLMATVIVAIPTADMAKRTLMICVLIRVLSLMKMRCVGHRTLSLCIGLTI